MHQFRGTVYAYAPSLFEVGSRIPQFSDYQKLLTLVYVVISVFFHITLKHFDVLISLGL